MSDEHVLHLVGPGHSGRAVKVQLLPGYKVDRAQERAIAEAAGLEGRVAGARVNARTIDHALGMAIKGVTEPVKRSIAVLESDIAAATATAEGLKPDAPQDVRAAAERRKTATTEALSAARSTLEAWTTTTESDLTGWRDGPGAGDPGPKTLQGLFTAKDLEALAAWYNKYHVPTAADVEAILGNVMMVA